MPDEDGVPKWALTCLAKARSEMPSDHAFKDFPGDLLIKQKIVRFIEAILSNHGYEQPDPSKAILRRIKYPAPAAAPVPELEV